MLALAALSLAACQSSMQPSAHQEKNATLRDQIAQKFMIDMRYYCDQRDQPTERHCRQPMTELPPELAQVITESNLGGIILFADNLVDHQQTIKLTHDLQQAAKKSSLGIPLFIAVDQEGGRVFRTARHETTAFTGNMAIGATYAEHGTYYAEKSAEIIATELKVLGFNVNHAPTVDVNSNPKNPVINVRSYGEEPEVVSKLGLAQIKAFQNQGIIGTLKHFPGHGDTAVDSHVGLPRVNHDIENIHQLDVAPYKAIFEQLNAGMVMTSHLQFPALDSTTFIAKDGKTVIKPATMSRAIITDFLRGELGYNGVVVSDAMDMAGISHFYTKPEAIVAAFKAGVDIAEMGVKIRTPEDLTNLNEMIDFVVTAVESGELDKNEIFESFKRIQTLKSDYKLTQQFDYSVEQRISQAQKVIGSKAHRAVEQQLAIDAVTQVTGKPDDVIITDKDTVHLIMPDMSKCVAIKQALKNELPNIKVTCTSALSVDEKLVEQQIKAADVVIGAHISPRQSAAEMGGMDDLKANKALSLKVADAKVIYNLLAAAKKQSKRVIFVSLRTPYEISDFSKVADATLATYSYNTYSNNSYSSNTYQEATSDKLRSPALEGLAHVLAGKVAAKGKLPVTVTGI